MKFAYQTDKNAKELDNVGVGDGVETSSECVEDGYQRRDHHRCCDVDSKDHWQRGSFKQILFLRRIK